MSINEKKKRVIEELRLSIRAACSTLISVFSVDDAIAVVKVEKHKRDGIGPSEEFESALVSLGSIRATCELCKREHFVSEGDFEDGELDELREKARMEPEKYIEEGRYDMLDVGYIDGKQVVLGCDCKLLSNYESWIWANRYTIAKYLKKRAENMALDSKFANEVAADAELVTRF